MNYFNPLSGLRLANKIKRESRWQFPVLFAINVLWGAIASFVAKDVRDFLALFSPVAVLSSLVILWISIRSGAMISQAYAIAESSTPAIAHDFTTFEAHIAWLRHRLVPTEFKQHPINLYLALSTPAYGLAVTNDENRSISGFLEWLDGWVAYYEGMPPESVDRPTIQLCLWKPEAHRTTFRSTIDPATADPRREQDQRDYIGKLAVLYKRLYEVNKTGRAACRILFTEESHTRWFMAGGGAEERAGLIIMFSPIITPRAVKDHKWRLVGVSFSDRGSFERLSKFYFNLMESYGVQSNQIERFADAQKWLLEHYEMT